MEVKSESSAANKRESNQISISLDSIQGLEFRVKFNETDLQDLFIDEPVPIGQGHGPDPARLLASAVGGCLSASLLFCARKLRLDMTGLHADIKVSHTRNEKGRLRIGKIDVDIQPTIGDPDPQKLQRCLELFEDFCVVTQSVRKGLDVSVNIKA